MKIYLFISDVTDGDEKYKILKNVTHRHHQGGSCLFPRVMRVVKMKSYISKLFNLILSFHFATLL